MRVRRFRDDEIAPFHRAFIDAGARLGLPELDDLESLDGVPSVCAEPSNSPEGVRWNAAFAYLDPVRGRPELEIARRGDGDRRRWWRAAARSASTLVGPGGVADSRGPTWWWWPAARTARRSCCCAAASVPPRSCGTWAWTSSPTFPGWGATSTTTPASSCTSRRSTSWNGGPTAFAATGQAGARRAGVREGGDLAQRRMACSTLHVFPEVALDGRLAIFAALLTPRSRGALDPRSADPDVAPR